jgi:hypothetical protein
MGQYLQYLKQTGGLYQFGVLDQQQRLLLRQRLNNPLLLQTAQYRQGCLPANLADIGQILGGGG